MLTFFLSAVIAAVLLALLLFPLLKAFSSESWEHQRENAPTANQVLADDDLPVVYLRPFEIDGAKTSSWRHLESIGLFSPTDEAEIAGQLRRIGPVVAIGFPGEHIPRDIGAARVQCPHDEWQAFIQNWMKKARLIVLVVGKSDGVAWELETIRKNGFLRKTIVVLSDSVDQPQMLLQFVRDYVPEMAVALPDNLDTGCSIHFRNPAMPQVFPEQGVGFASRRARSLDACLASWMRSA